MITWLYLDICHVKFNFGSNSYIVKNLYRYWYKNCNKVEFIKEPVHKLWDVILNYNNLSSIDLNYEKKTIIYNYNGPYRFTEALSFIREIVTKFSLINGHFWVHASIFEINRKTILVVGKKGSGKTTWLLLALLHLKAKFIGNDQIQVVNRNSILFVRRWRPDIKLKSNTIKLLNVPIKNFDKKGTYFVMTTKLAKQSFNLTEYNNRRGIVSYFLDIPAISLANLKPHKIDIVVFPMINGPSQPSRIQSMRTKNTLWNIIEKDDETIKPLDLNNWNDKHTFWKNRLVNLKVHSSTLLPISLFKAFKDVPTYIVSRRANIDMIKRFLIRI